MPGVAKKVFNVTGTWTVPAGITRIRAIGIQAPPLTLDPGRSSSANVCYHIIDRLGNAYAFGNNTGSPLGVSSTTSAFSSPIAVTGALTFRQIVSHNQGTLALDLQSQLWACGTSINGELGDGTVAQKSSFVAVLGGFRWSKILTYSGGQAGCAMALAVDGTTYSWGINTKGQLGLNDVTPRSSPVAVLGSHVFQQIMSDSTSVIGLDTAGAAWGWGVNTSGQLGVGNVTPQSSPLAVLGSKVFTRISLNPYSANECAVFGLTAAGVLWAWGRNTNGQLGVGDVTPRSSPVAVLGSKVFQYVTDGGAQILGLDTSGTAWAWGNNTGGALGVGDVTPRSSPVAVLGSKTFQNIYSHGNGTTANICSFGIDINGDLWAWGRNDFGQLGVGDVTPRSSPVAVLGAKKWAYVLPGTGVTVRAVTVDGIMHAWGKNQYGEVGVGDVTPRSSPVAITQGLTTFAKICQPAAVHQVQYIDVTPNRTYTVVIGQGASFGGTPIGAFCDQVVVEYDE